jgi:hypothetical protein
MEQMKKLENMRKVNPLVFHYVAQTRALGDWFVREQRFDKSNKKQQTILENLRIKRWRVSFLLCCGKRKPASAGF